MTLLAFWQGGDADAQGTTAAWDLPSFRLPHQRRADLWEVLGCLQALRWPKQPLGEVCEWQHAMVPLKSIKRY